MCRGMEVFNTRSYSEVPKVQGGLEQRGEGSWQRADQGGYFGHIEVIGINVTDKKASLTCFKDENERIRVAAQTDPAI